MSWQDTPCVPFQGPLDRKGYGRHGGGASRRIGRTFVAHRRAYEDAHGVRLPVEIVVDHLYRNPSCVNVSHLEAVDSRTNTLRGTSFAAVNAAKTHCIRGHVFDEENTYRWRGARMCRTCRRIYNYERKAAA